MYDAIVALDDTPVDEGVLYLRPGKNLRTGESSLNSHIGTLTSLEKDLLVMASSVFACDLAFKRGERENITRRINLRIPVSNFAILNSVQDDIKYALFVLSHDAWNIQFVQNAGQLESVQEWPNTSEEKVLLFSGGLDSFAAALEFGELGHNVHLVSHITANAVVSGAQKHLFNYLEQSHPKQFSRVAIRVGGNNNANHGYPFPPEGEREDTQRTRSFLFLVLAAIVARRRAANEIIVIAENGQLAIHLPLTAARISAFSTHTAHPEFVHCMSQILTKILGFDIKITNPYLYRTKAEVVKTAVGKHLGVVPHAVSCWKASRVAGSDNHCGICVPCLIRRIAVEANGAQIQEYHRDLLNENIISLAADDDGKRNLIELAEFVTLFHSTQSNAALEEMYPDLLNECIDSAKAVDMYRRFTHEALTVFDRYPNVKRLME